MNPAGLPAPAECAQGESRGCAGAAACDTPAAGMAETGRGAGAGGVSPSAAGPESWSDRVPKDKAGCPRESTESLNPGRTSSALCPCPGRSQRRAFRGAFDEPWAPDWAPPGAVRRPLPPRSRPGRILFDELMVKEERKSSEQHELYSSFILFLSEKNSKNTLMQNDFSGTISQMDGSRRNFLQLNHKPWDELFF
ncbi:uncharacterized protein GJ701_005185 isoform 1-T1 [Geothlypis trichas]